MYALSDLNNHVSGYSSRPFATHKINLMGCSKDRSIKETYLLNVVPIMAG